VTELTEVHPRGRNDSIGAENLTCAMARVASACAAAILAQRYDDGKCQTLANELY
jgi:hypothetical protein